MVLTMEKHKSRMLHEWIFLMSKSRNGKKFGGVVKSLEVVGLKDSLADSLKDD